MIDFPALPALAFVILIAGLVLAVAVVAQALRVPRAKGSMAEVSLRFARWMFASLLAASGIWIAIAPRADHPLLDAVERAFPAIRASYMDDPVRARSAEPVGKEERGVARESHRWWIGGVLLALAASFVVSLPSRRTTPRNFEG